MRLTDIVVLDGMDAVVNAMTELRSARRIAWALPIFLVPAVAYAAGCSRKVARAALTFAGATVVLLSVQHVQWSLKQIPVHQAEAARANSDQLMSELGISVAPDDTHCLQTLVTQPTARCAMPSADLTQTFVVTSIDGEVVLAEIR